MFAAWVRCRYRYALPEAMMMQSQGQHADALDAYERAAVYDPTDTQVLLQLGPDFARSLGARQPPTEERLHEGGILAGHRDQVGHCRVRAHPLERCRRRRRRSRERRGDRVRRKRAGRGPTAIFKELIRSAGKAEMTKAEKEIFNKKRVSSPKVF